MSPNIYNNPILFKDPSVNVSTPTYTYTPNYSATTPIGDIINKIGTNLKAPDAFTNQLSFQDYVNPIKTQFDANVATQFRPEYERFQLNPFKQTLDNNAVGQSQNLGWKNTYSNQLTDFENQNYYNPIQTAWNGLSDQYRGMYNTQLKKSETSPQSMTALAQAQAEHPTNYNVENGGVFGSILQGLKQPLSNSNYGNSNSIFPFSSMRLPGQ